MEILWYTAMSMDGKLASVDHDLGFLDTIADNDASVGDFPEFIASVDAIIVGAQTLRWLIRGGHGWPHGDKPTWVITHDRDLVRGLDAAIPPRIFEGDLDVLSKQIAATGAQRVWLSGGGTIAGELLALDLVDEVVATIAPVALGAGPSLFGDRPLDLRRFDVLECRKFAGNAVRVRWHRQRT